MKFKWKKKFSFGPLRINTSQGRMTSYSLVFGRLSWNSRTRKWTFDTPGPGSVEWGGRQQGKR